jgi:cyclophilin family peptidyl-prolyl cis-trans isomerase
MDPSLLPLLRRLEQLSEEFRELREGVHRAVDIADRDPEMALTRARKVLEYVVRDVFERHIQEPPGTRPLENLLQRLVKDGHLPGRVEAYANAIRLLGNVGTHRFGEKFTAADVNLCLTQLMPILEWYFEVERPEATAQQPAPPRPTTAVGRPTGPPATEAAPAASRARKRTRLITLCVAAGVVLLGLVGLWASGVFNVKSKDGNAVQAPRDGGSAGSDIPEKDGDLGARLVKAANPVVIMDTSVGTIRVELFEDKAPITVKNFLGYVDKGFYDGTIFHRVIGTLVIQGGGFTKDRREKETGAPIKNEAGNGVPNERGTIAMARTQNPDSATAQFFINVRDNAGFNKAQARDGVGYAVFGEVIEGMDVVDKIKAVKTGYMPFTDRDGHNLNFTEVPEEVVLIRSLRREVSAAPEAQ